MLRSCLSVLLLVVYVLVPLDAFCLEAGVTVDGGHRYFRAGEVPVKNIVVTNNHKSPLNFETRIDLLINPGSTKSGEVTEREAAPDDFIFAPKLFRLNPGESRQVRMVLAKPLDDSEKAYSIGFQPIEIPDEDGGVSDEQVSMGVGFIITNGMLVMVSPKKPEVKISYTRDESKIYIKNDGNISVDMRRRPNVCFDDSGEDCMTLPGKRIYPGDTFELEMAGYKGFDYFYKIYDKESGTLKIEPLYE